MAEEAWRQHRARCVTGYVFVPITTDRMAEEIWVSGRSKVHADVGSLVVEANGGALAGRASRFYVVDDGHGAASIVMGDSVENLVGIILTRSDRAGITLHGHTLAEAGALDAGYDVPNARGVLSREEVLAHKRALRRDVSFPATAFDSTRARRRTAPGQERGARR